MSTSVITHPSDYIPEIARQRAALLKQEADDPRRRLMIFGISGCGKTYSTVTTAPLPVVIDYDNQLDDERVIAKLAGHYPMWDDKFVKEQLKITGTPLQRLIAVIDILAPVLTVNHTLIFDSASTFADLMKENLEARVLTEAKTKDGVNSYWLWAEWSKCWRTLCSRIKNLRCNAILIMHEAEMRDEATGRLEKYGWLLQGKEFTPRIPQFFTDVVRMTHTVKPSAKGGIEEEKWLWQIKPTPDFPAAKSRCKQQLIHIPAGWAELLK